MKNKFLSFFGVGLCVGMLICCGTFSETLRSSQLPDDAALYDHLVNNREPFARIISTFEKAPDLRSFATDYSGRHELESRESTMGDSVNRTERRELNQDMKLANLIGVRREIQRGENVLVLTVDRADLQSDALTEQLYEEKGYVYTGATLTPLESSLDREMKGNSVFFKKLEDGWYLFYRVNAQKPE